MFSRCSPVNKRCLCCAQNGARPLWPILAGSDAPNPTTAHGWSLLVELDMLQRAGLPLESVLHAATAAPAKAFALPHQGRIADGMKADLLLLDAGATTNLRALFHPQAVWKNGFEL